MKKRAEIAVAALAVMFICFALGYFAGRRSVPSEVSVSTGTVVITPEIITPLEEAVVYPAGEPEEPVSNLSVSASPVIAAPAPSATPETPLSPPEETAPADNGSADAAAATATPEPTPAGEPHYTDDGLLRINLATKAEFEKLPGIGEVIASRIIEYREQNGPFSKLSTLKAIKGIGDSRYNDIKNLTTVE